MTIAAGVLVYMLTGIFLAGLALAWAERRHGFSRNDILDAVPVAVAASLLWPLAIALLIAGWLLGAVLTVARRTVLR